MKNFPHQFNDLSKLTNALSVFAQLLDDGKDVNDDAIVGTALARAGIYQFRDKTVPIEVALIKEKQKPPSNQGTRTAARELRRFFLLLGFLTNSLDISKLGNALLEAEDGGTKNLIWRTAMLDLALVDSAGRVSHPYRILLKMVEERHAKRTDHQHEHNVRCNLLPPVDEMLRMLNSGLATRRQLAEEYSTPEVPISETFVVRLVGRFGYQPGSGGIDSLHKENVIAFANECIPCYCCGLLTTDDALTMH